MRSALLLLLAASAAVADEAPLAFGFRGFEIYKLDPQIERDDAVVVAERRQQ